MHGGFLMISKGRVIAPVLTGLACLMLAGCKTPEEKALSKTDSQIKAAQRYDMKPSRLKKQLAKADKQIRKSAKKH
jgi:outer membrane biogenesis lipoprotein LolB